MAISEVDDGTEEGPAPKGGGMVHEVRTALLQQPRTLPSKYFYDDRGSALFEQITEQPEYYQTRTEEALLESVAPTIAERTRPDELVELGSGVGRKIRLLLDAMRTLGTLRRCVMLDINALFLQRSVRRLAAEYPEARVTGVHGDFQADLTRLGPGGRRLVILLAGTMGNIAPSKLPGFLRDVGRQLEPDDGFLVGVDVIKDRERLEEAYNDAAGVTAAFNRNILLVMNREFGADFDPASWEHVAFWDEGHQWIEMRLRSRCAQRVTLPGVDLVLEFEAGEEIRTEISAKYTRRSLANRLDGTNLRLDEWYADPEQRFALALLRREA